MEYEPTLNLQGRLTEKVNQILDDEEWKLSSTPRFAIESRSRSFSTTLNESIDVHQNCSPNTLIVSNMLAIGWPDEPLKLSANWTADGRISGSMIEEGIDLEMLLDEILELKNQLDGQA